MFLGGVKINFRKLLIIAAFALAGFVYSSTAEAATLFLAPSSGTYNVGSNFSVAVKVNTEDVIINAGEGTIIFNPNELAVTSLSKNGSVFNIWVQEPVFSNALGTINFGGIILNPGYTGASGTILTVNLKAKAVSNALLSFSSGAVLANDGLGTNILSAMGGGAYSLKTSSTVPQITPETTALSVPVIKSLTHPDQLKWYSNNNPELSWTLPEGTDNVSHLLDQEPGSDPGSIPDGLKNSAKFTNINDGIWYFHVKFGKLGKWGPIAHYKLRIDTIPPPILEITRDIDKNDPTNPQVIIVFKSTDDLSGVDFYQMKIGDGDWFKINRSLEGQPYKLPMAQISGFPNISIRATDFAENSVITKFDVDLIEKIFVKAPVEQGEPLELKGKAKPNSRLIISISIAEVAKQMLGAQVSSLALADGSGNYTKKIEETADENGDWQVELSDLPPVKYILAINLQDYSIFFSKTPTTAASTSWFSVRSIGQKAFLWAAIIVLVGLLVSLFEFYKAGIRKLWRKIRRQQEPVIIENEIKNKSSENDKSPPLA